MFGYPATGHIHPTLGTIRELVLNGEDVIYYATPPFREKIVSTGAEFRSYGEHESFERKLGHGGLLGGMAGLIETTEGIMDALVSEMETTRPDYILMEAHAVWANLLQQITKLPAVTLCSMFAFNQSLISNNNLIEYVYRNAPKETLLDGLKGLTEYLTISQRIDQRYATRSPGIVDYVGNPQDLNIVFTSREFQQGGEVFDDSYRFVGPCVSSRLEDKGFPFEKLGPEPLIYISLGTMYNDEVDFYHSCFEAFSDTPFQVVMAVGNRLEMSGLAKQPDNFIVREYVPQLQILERASLFITHGGLNSAHEGILHEVPMIVLPQQADHFVVARRVVDLGAGVIASREDFQADAIRQKANLILEDPSYREKSRQIGETLRNAGGSVRAANEVFDFKKRKGLK
jgi:MGT family glycosyltransferase